MKTIKLYKSVISEKCRFYFSWDEKKEGLQRDNGNYAGVNYFGWKSIKYEAWYRNGKNGEMVPTKKSFHTLNEAKKWISENLAA